MERSLYNGEKKKKTSVRAKLENVKAVVGEHQAKQLASSISEFRRNPSVEDFPPGFAQHIGGVLGYTTYNTLDSIVRNRGQGAT